MSIGKQIKQLRELRNYTQSYVAKELDLSLSGYSKLERDETDITISRLKQIAKVLDTDLATLLNFDSKQVFNQYYNKTANANGVVQNQQITDGRDLQGLFHKLNDEIVSLKEMISRMQSEGL